MPSPQSDRISSGIPFKVLLLFLLVLVLSFSCGRQSVDVQMLEDRIRNVLQLETAEYVYRDLVYRAVGSDFIGIVTRDTRVLAEMKLRVIAGIDITKGLEVRAKEDPERGTTIQVTMPHARILAVDADESTIRQFMLKEYGFMKDGRISLLEFSDQLEANKKAITADALRRGILLQAETNASRMITQILALAGCPQVNIRFGTGDIIEAPATEEK